MFSSVKQEWHSILLEFTALNVHITEQNYSQVDDNVIEKTNTCVGAQIQLTFLVIFNAKYFNKCRNVAVLFSFELQFNSFERSMKMCILACGGGCVFVRKEFM